MNPSMRRIPRMLAVVAFVAAGGTVAAAGSNLLEGYPGPACEEPPEIPDRSEVPEPPEAPERPETFETEEAIAGYNAKVDAYNAEAGAYNAKIDAYTAKVDAYNASMERFTACVNEYAANAVADVERIRKRAREAIDRLEAIDGSNE